MKNKEECFKFLDEAEKRIKAHVWDRQVNEPEDLVSHKDMLDHVLKDFDIPVPQEVDDFSLLLPEGWLPDENPQNSTDYDHVTERFIEVYDLLRFEYSREFEAFCIEAEQDERDMHADFFRIVGWRK
jgi:hypothetical protein